MLLVQWVEKALQCQQEGRKCKIFARITAKSSRWFAAVTHVEQSWICTNPLRTDFDCKILRPQVIKCIHSECSLLVCSRWNSFFKDGTQRQNCNRICSALWGRNAFVAKTWQELYKQKWKKTRSLENNVGTVQERKHNMESKILVQITVRDYKLPAAGEKAKQVRILYTNPMWTYFFRRLLHKQHSVIWCFYSIWDVIKRV